MRSDDLNWAPIPGQVCNIPATLTSGQTFRWRQVGPDWIGVIAESVVRLRPEARGFHWQTYPVAGRWPLIEQYFALDVDLWRLCGEWRADEPKIDTSIRRFEGLRVLRQEPEEVFFSFLCSSCNTIVKITRSIRALEERAGEPIAAVAGETYYRFPSAESIARIPESTLRADLWGYRAPRVRELAAYVAAQRAAWLESLRAIPYTEARTELAGLYGIGAKLADCICLFGLGHDDSVPVDTHVRQIAIRLFRPDLAGKSLTPAVYESIAGLFRERFHSKPGWAQQYLYMESLST